ncbi:tetratricopeptide repeat protein [Flavobacterium sp. SM2513]|uniref:tetratricopeptide repeat protein n=1 Tax=Flavobacterium sp. SM2513 TaxID=3424766 RepID=UPI003D7F45FD
MRFILFIVLFSTYAVAQESRKDSILRKLEAPELNSDKSSLYFDLAKEYKSTQIDSAIYFAKKGYEISKKANNQEFKLKNAAALGDFYIEKNEFSKAKLYYTIYTEGIDREKNIADYCETKMIIANIEMLQNNYTKALKGYYECLDIAKEHKLTNIIPHLYNNLGNLYFDIEDYKDAREYFNTAHKKFIKNKDEYNAAIVLTNISNIHNKYGENEQAIKGYLQIVRIFSANGNWENLVSTYHSLAEIYITQKQFIKAQEYIDEALKLIAKNENKESKYLGPISFYKAEVYFTAAELAYNENKMNEAINYAHKSLQLSYANEYKKSLSENARILSKIFDKKNRIDSAFYYSKIYIKFSEEYNVEYDLKKIVQSKMQYQFDDILKAKAVEEVKKQAKNNRTKLIYLGISIFTILGIIIVLLLYRNQKIKTTKVILTKEKLELEKVTLDHDLDYKKKELTSKMIYVLEKNEFIISIAKKLLDLKPDLSKANQVLIQQIIYELNQNSSNKIWDEFEIRFKEVHSEFYDNLNRLYPDLTPNEIKICAFLRLNMSTKEISAITHQSIKSINMARFRLRKKLNIETEDNLISYLIHL